MHKKSTKLESNKRSSPLKKILRAVGILIGLALCSVVGYFALFAYAVGQVGWR